MKQAQLNREMVEAGKNRYWTQVQNAADKGRESDTLHAQRLMHGATPGLLDALNEWIAEAKSGKAGRAHGALAPLTSLEAPKVCLLAIQVVLDSLSQSPTVSHLVCKIGRMLECEAKLLYYRDADFDYWRRLEARAKGLKLFHAQRRYNFFRKEMTEHFRATGMLDWTPWSEKTMSAAGTIMLDLIKTATGFVEESKDFSKNPTKPINVVVASESMLKWIAGFHNYAELMNPVYMPTVEPPEDWTMENIGQERDLFDPYSNNLMKTRSKALIDDLQNCDMPTVLSAINAIQQTAWQINQPVLEAVRHVWEMDLAVAGVERRSPLPVPVLSEEAKESPEAIKAFRKEKGRIVTLNKKSGGRTIATAKTLALGQMFKDEPRIYFPHQVDFRGRMYPVSSYLQPQGTDMAKGILQFADPKPITHPDQANWIAIHCANCWGEDKVSMDERIAWTLSHRREILSVAADPIGDLWWTDADKPVQFLAAAMEWAKWLQVGVGMMSHLPVSVDGTNNGLQILSLLCRDEEAGRATNVTPSDAPEDIYGDVAKLVEKALIEDMSNEDGNVRWMADFWIRFGIDRKTCKRPVMIYPYGGTRHACNEYVHEWFDEACDKRDVSPFTDRSQRGKAVTYLAKHVWFAVNAVVGRPKDVMHWIQEAARIVTKTGQPVEWVTPVGLLVRQTYRRSKSIKVEVLVNNTIKAIRLKEETPELDGRRQTSGVSPNYVHSLDAAALALTVETALKAGVTSFAMVHDSYGTHAACMEELAASLRYSFATLFSRDLLADLKAQIEKRFGVELPALPGYGSLDPSSVLESEFFFA